MKLDERAERAERVRVCRQTVTYATGKVLELEFVDERAERAESGERGERVLGFVDKK